MSQLFVIIGMTGAGKSTIARQICRDLNLPRIRTTTTRPKRSEDDNEYIFATEEELFKDSGRYIGVREYHTFIEDTPKKHYYAVDKLALEAGTAVLITDFDGYKEICDHTPNVVGIYIHADKDIRYRRASKRAGFKADEFWRRDADDQKKFAIEKLVAWGKNNTLYIVNNSADDTLVSVIAKTKGIVEKYLKYNGRGNSKSTFYV
jgi:guanylate kinase